MQDEKLSVNTTAASKIHPKFLTGTIANAVGLLSLLLLATYSASAETAVSANGAAEFLNQAEIEASTSEMNQVTNVNQLTDVQTTDWAFVALQSLVERYGCIAGYPNSTFGGHRVMTRYEFAAGLNACLDRMNELIATATGDLVKKEDLASLQKLQEEFAAELATLRGRVDTLEARTAQLEANQFSTTTKLGGQVIVSVNAGGFDRDRIIDSTGQRILATKDPNPTVLYRASIDLDTSFTGSDLLKIRLDSGSGVIDNGRPDGARDNAAGVLEPFFGSVIDYSVKPPTVGSLGIGRLFYTFRPTQDLAVSIGPDIRTTDYVDRNSYANLSFLDFSTQAFVNNYILFPVDGPAAGAAIDWKPRNGALAVRALYAAGDPANPGETGLNVSTARFTPLLYPNDFAFNAQGKRGLFGDTYQGTVELEYAPSRSFALRLQYSGGEVFDKRFDVFGANVELTLGQRFGIFGRYGYGSYNDTAFGEIKPNYWMAGMGMRDLFTRGALAGVAVGQPFIANEIGNSTQTNYEAFYNYPFSRNIQITPTIQVIDNAGNQGSNGTILTGTLRTVFSF
ncbi:iron uptake porin [Fischerella sp. PCC 9605]|uniref:iron uptake porin n=1 Tax=Fischerella sp. PCC 9605 TaxID=1173024 RepID=UPI0004ACEACF|nr:iron uptake porin [Fischerella sp. PCC 9605]